MDGEGMEVNGRIRQLARFLEMALKERPQDFGIRTDRQGYVSLMDLMGLILDEPDFSWVTVKDVDEAVGSARPPLFEISGTRIRVAGRNGGSKPRGSKAKSGSRSRRRRKRKPGGKPTGEKAASQGSSAAARSRSPGDGTKTRTDGGGSTSTRRRRRRRRKPAAQPETKPKA